MSAKHARPESVSAGNTRPGGRVAPEIAKCRKTLVFMKAELGTWRKVAKAIGGDPPHWNPGYLYKVAKGDSRPSASLLKDLNLYRVHAPKGGFRVSGSRQTGNEIIRLLQRDADHSDGVSRVILSLMRQLGVE